MKREYHAADCLCTDCESHRLELIRRGATSADQGRKDDAEKNRTDLYPPASYLATCRALTYGEKKYAAWNWAKGIQYSRVYGALLRHLFAWFCGQHKDPESGLHHLDHAGCCLAFLQHYESDPRQYESYDDRPLEFIRCRTEATK